MAKDGGGKGRGTDLRHPVGAGRGSPVGDQWSPLRDIAHYRRTVGAIHESPAGDQWSPLRDIAHYRRITMPPLRLAPYDSPKASLTTRQVPPYGRLLAAQACGPSV